MTQNRVQQGRPTGGQFAANRRTESDIDLSGEAAPAQPVIIADLVEVSPATQRVLDAIESAGGQPIIVGGSVRDALIAESEGTTKQSPKDIDVEVYGSDTDQLLGALRRIGHASEVGQSFGVIKATVDGEEFDVSLPRRDVKVGDGHRGFEVQVDDTMSYAEAFGRRDFTINAIGWNPATGEVIDPHGGLADIQSRTLRHTSDAFDEDPERVLRGVRFAGRLGYELAPETIERCRALSGEFDKLPTERVWKEWNKIALEAQTPSASLTALHQVDWERHFPELAVVRDVPQDPRWHPEGTVDVHTGQVADVAAAIAVRDGLDDEQRTVLMFASMFHDIGKATHTQHQPPSDEYPDGRITSHGHAAAGANEVRSLLKRMGAPIRIVDQVAPIVREHMCTSAVGDREPTETDVRRLIRRLDADGRGTTIEQWARVCEADRGGRGTASGPSDAAKWVAIAHAIPPERPVLTPLLTGDHLIAAGLKPGPDFRPIMDDAIQAQDAGEITDEASAVQWLRRRLDAS